MMSAQPTTAKLLMHPAKATFLILRVFRAVIILVAVSLLWLVLFLCFLPLLIAVDLSGLRKKFRRHERESPPGEAATTEIDHQIDVISSRGRDSGFIFDRRSDISKLFGCNTRNVRYRWDIFSKRLDALHKEFKEPRALDFGAGSLRDSYELAVQGFRVVSLDLDDDLLERYAKSYQWAALPSTPQISARPVETLFEQTGPQFFHLAISFDVVEHLEDPASYLKHLYALLHDRGFFFCIVPNKASLCERYFRYSISKLRKKGIRPAPGVPHLQFKSPAEWVAFLSANGFRVVEHDMAIGPLVNDLWHGLLGLPLTIYVDPVMNLAAYGCHLPYSSAFIEAFYPAWLMERINVLDMVLKRWLRHRFGWNLIVAQKAVRPADSLPGKSSNRS